MENIDNSLNSVQTQEANSENLKKEILRYVKNWPWFLLSVIIALIVAYTYLRYTNNVYQSSAKVKILKDDSGGLDLSGLQGSSPLIDMSKVNLENEMEILQSRRIARKVVNNLNLESSYYRSGDIKVTEIWGEESPFSVTYQKNDTIENSSIPYLNIVFNSLSEYEIIDPDSNDSQTFNIGESVVYQDYPIVVNLNPDYYDDLTKIIGLKYAFKFNTTESAINQLVNKIKIEPLGEKSEVLEISLKGEHKGKIERTINELIDQFNNDGIKDNSEIAKRTEEFVIGRLDFLVSELDTVEGGLVDFKRENDLIEIENNAQAIYGKSSEAELKKFELSNQLSLAESFKAEIMNQGEFQLLPANIGLDNSNVNSFTNTYNDKVLERERLLVSSTEENPTVKELDKLITQLRNNILTTIDGYIRNLRFSLNEVKERESRFNYSFSKLPGQEKKIRDIKRQQLVKEKLYLFLLQKREEAALSYAITSPILKVVDYAHTNPNPISPRGKVVYLASVTVAMFIPFAILFIIYLFDTRLKRKDQIKVLMPDIPIVAEVPQDGKKLNNINLPGDHTPAAEAFRIMRTNLNYMNVNLESSSDSKLVYVTSTTKGEGKTYVAVNLASSLAAAKKKVLLVGCDLRNPQIHNYIGLSKDKIGVTNYLYDDSLTFQDLIIKNPIKQLDLDIILSGAIPPNPSELLMSDRFTQFVNEARSKYEYVIFDTAPTILVTDTILISRHANMTLYVARSEYTETRLLPHIRDVYKQKKLVNMGIVMNGLDEFGIDAYNYGYGYGYGINAAKKKPFWKIW